MQVFSMDRFASMFVFGGKFALGTLWRVVWGIVVNRVRCLRAAVVTLLSRLINFTEGLDRSGGEWGPRETDVSV